MQVESHERKKHLQSKNTTTNNNKQSKRKQPTGWKKTFASCTRREYQKCMKNSNANNNNHDPVLKQKTTHLEIFSEENMKQRSASHTIMEIQIETPMSYPITPIKDRITVSVRACRKGSSGGLVCYNRHGGEQNGGFKKKN